MEKIKFYDMKGVNCWIINLKPFEQNTPNERIRSLQDECVQNKIFGIGWRTGYFDTHSNVILDENTKKAYKASLGENDNSAKAATDRMSEIKCGDLAIMRLRDGHIYLGKVTEPAFHDGTILKGENSNRLSWMCRVEKWVKVYEEIKENDRADKTYVPSEIMGRFSQRRQATVTKIKPYKQRLLMLAMYETASSGKTNVPKVILNENNFTRALSYTDLEDWVCAYIYTKHFHDGYMLLPSSGKVSRQKYEFTFVSNKPDKKPITCQVKNQNSEQINIADYINDKNYDKIYLFSGNGNIINNELIKDTDNIEIIDRSELFNVVKNSGFKFMYDKLSKYHSFSESPDLEKIEKVLKDEKGWQKKRKFSKDSDDFKMYKYGKTQETSWISFGYDGLYITDEFDSFIIEWQDKNTEKIKEQLENDLR